MRRQFIIKTATVYRIYVSVRIQTSEFCMFLNTLMCLRFHECMASHVFVCEDMGIQINIIVY